MRLTDGKVVNGSATAALDGERMIVTVRIEDAAKETVTYYIEA